MTLVQQLKAAKARIENPVNWTTLYYARDVANYMVYASEPQACKWCALGALRAENLIRRSPATLLLERIAQEAFGMCVPDVNDSLGHAAVMKLYDRAIQIAESEA